MGLWLPCQWGVCGRWFGSGGLSELGGARNAGMACGMPLRDPSAPGTHSRKLSGSSVPADQLVAKLGGTFVFLSRHGVCELLVQCSVYLIMVADPVLQIVKLAGHLLDVCRVLEWLAELFDSFQALVDLFDGGFGIFLLQVCQGRGLGSVEEYQSLLLSLVALPMVVGNVPVQEAHQSERVVGVGHGAIEFAYRHPADSAVIELGEFEIDLLQLPIIQFDGAAVAKGLADEQVEIGFGPSWSGSVGASCDFHLEHAEVDSHLQNVPAVRGTNEACTHRVGIIGPILEEVVKVAIDRHEQ